MTKLSRRTFAAGTAAAAGLASLSVRVSAQGKQITFILPNAAGSGVDATTRTVAAELGKVLNATIVVNNQPGAGGVVGTQQMVRSAPDGTTLSIVSTNHVIYPSVLKSIPFDPIADITPVAILGGTPLVMVVNPKVPAKNAAELTALLKANPDKHTYASSGNGTILHLAAAMYVDQAGVKMTHVPYKGVAPMVTDLLGGQVDMGILAYPSVMGHIKSGALRPIGFCTEKRISAAADIPTFIEQGMKDFVTEAWLACIGPAKMPAEEVAKIHAALKKAFAAPEVAEAIAKQATVIDIKPIEAGLPFLKNELAKYAALAKKIGLEAQ